MSEDSATVTELDYSLHHIQAELARLDVLIGYELRRWQVAGDNPIDAFSGLYISEEEAERLLLRPLGVSWGQSIALDEEEQQAFVETYRQAIQQVEAAYTASTEAGITPRLIQLARTFELDEFERDALLVCLAPALDRRYERLYGYLQDDITCTWPSVNLIFDLLCDPGPSRLLQRPTFTDNHSLLAHSLIRWLEDSTYTAPPSHLSRMLRPDETIVGWLTGQYRSRADLRPHVTQLHPEYSERDRLLAGIDTIEDLTRAHEQNVLLALHGRDETGRQAAIRCLAAATERPLLIIDTAGALETGKPKAALVQHTLRDARLLDAIPVFSGWDAIYDDGMVPAPVLKSLCAHPESVITAGEMQWHPRGIERTRRVQSFEFPVPTYEHRLKLWNHFLEDVEQVPDVNVPDLAGTFKLTSGQIRDTVATARDMSAQAGSPLSNDDLFAAARLHSNPRLSSLAQKIVPRYEWADIVLPDDQIALLRELVATVRQRPTVLETWGLGKKLTSSAGITCLFSGPPGTGKTMAAEVIAGDLGLDLYKIDLSSVVSKYIGETEKNLEKIFNEAQSSNAILFFDEADAIFGKRSEVKDAHDRYANVEVSYLLQRMEAYDGVTILATNLRANLDDAFTRRLQFAIDFPFPDETYRKQIWETLFPVDVPRSDDIDLALLAERFRLAGGNIRNVIVGAAYLAAADGGSVTMQHLLHSTRRELQKMGRLVNERDLQLYHD